MARRSGVTLVEVLVAIFVMAIGMLALLTLFPLGVLRMAQAIRDDRCASSSNNADRLAKIHDVRNDLDVLTQLNDAFNNGATNNDLFANPCPNYAAVAPPINLPNADPYAESYPIFVDPIGYYAVPTPDWVGGPGAEGILRRRPVEFTRRGGLPLAQVKLNILQSFSLWDDMFWEATQNGISPAATPQIAAPVVAPAVPAVLRDGRYSWGYVLRRPQTADRSVVDLTVVVYDQRTLALTQTQALAEHVYLNRAFFYPANNTIVVKYTGLIAPPVRPGQWILDATFYQPSPGTGSTNANFYKVVASEDFTIGVDTFVRFEVQNPIRGYAKYTPVADPLNPTGPQIPGGTILVLEGVAEVFEKGPARLP